jgi:RNA polymerase sigma-70 factor (ECF subfamily)
VTKEQDQKLIHQCIKGDRKAQKALYDAYASTMFGVCLRYSNSGEEAKDILQEGFIKVFTKIDQFNGSGAFEGWMKRIFINCALEYYRINKVHMYHADTMEAESNPHHDFTLEKISRKEILDVMNKMAAGYRTVLNLYIIEGYSHGEIGEMLGISEGTSKSQLSRARAILQEELLKLAK